MMTEIKPRKLSEWQQRVDDYIPWVRLLKTPQQCTGWMRNHKQCKNPAYWKFTSFKSRHVWAMNVPNGTYCWKHLVSRGLYGSMDEEARTDNHFYKVGIYCQSVSPSGSRCARLNDNHSDHHTAGYSLPHSENPDLIRYRDEWTEQS